MFGLCLQRNWLVPVKALKEVKVQNGHEPFFYPVLGPLGHVLVGGWWRHFVAWFRRHYPQPGFMPEVPGLSFSNPWLFQHAHSRRDLWTSW